MGLLSAILVAVWLVGIVWSVYGVVTTLKSESQDEVVVRFQEALDGQPVPVLLVLTVLIVAWPATLVYSLVMKGKK